MIAVVDTSAVMRLFIPDGPIPNGLEAFFRGVETGRNLAIAPELLLIETVNVVLKKQRRGELTSSEADELIRLLRELPVRYYGHEPLMCGTHHLAMKTGLTGYDALFLALAKDCGVPVFTADNELDEIVRKIGLSPGDESWSG